MILEIVSSSLASGTHSFNHLLWKTQIFTTQKVVCYVVSYCTCLLLNFLDESEPALTRRTEYLIECLSKRSLAAICSCFEFQFRNVIPDRVIILRQISRLHQLRKDGKVLSWSFFTQAFNIITVDKGGDTRISTCSVLFL